ncbi:T6SS effector amidase Tae4 family protein [uncultured Massilia sp.]|uniref:T6SS effector amidase Tae4 family protein n=1 Tax=uncultured Massilia sp. TaxID=169973 RepID=UPI00258E9624|nr:T6SS effector amidase Tae4 family protein [uncultured Massilia sp.]
MSKMPNVPFRALYANYPSTATVKPEQLYASIGHPEKLAIPGWENTCAVRMSVALVKSGVLIGPGTLTSKGPQFKGARIESRQKQLSDFLVKRWGQPEKFKGSEAARTGIGRRRGVISFFKLLGETDNQGHIDLVAPNEWGTLLCANSCYWGAVEIWFWPLK